MKPLAKWWMPLGELDKRAQRVFMSLLALQTIDGYLGTVLTQTITYAADEFAQGNRAQSWVLGIARVGVLIALGTSALADKKGRKSLLIGAGIASCAFTLLGGLSPNLWFLAGSQLIARGFSTTMGILIAIVAVEEMPAHSRAWVASVLTAFAGLGAGIATALLFAVDYSERGWRVIYLVASIGIVFTIMLAKHLPESRRFLEATQAMPESKGTASVMPEGKGAKQAMPAGKGSASVMLDRLWLLAVSAFLLSAFWAPAFGFRNDFLKDERGFSGAEIIIFTMTTATPVGIGLLLGGYLAEKHGRRRVAAFGISVGAALTSVSFFNSGFSLWSLTLFGGIIEALAVPALVVYGPELFGTRDRGRTNGFIVTIGVLGSALGLLFAGELSERLDTLGPAIAILGVGPLIVALLILLRYPETGGLELEAINPQDARD